MKEEFEHKQKLIENWEYPGVPEAFCIRWIYNRKTSDCNMALSQEGEEAPKSFLVTISTRVAFPKLGRDRDYLWEIKLSGTQYHNSCWLKLKKEKKRKIKELKKKKTKVSRN